MSSIGKAALPTVEEILADCGPLLSTEIKEKLVSGGLSDDAARKRVQRASSTVHRLRKVRFPHNARFLYLPHQYGSDEFFSSLINAFESTSSAYGLAISALEARGSIIPFAWHKGIFGSPTRLKGHISSDHILSRLIEIELLQTGVDSDTGQYITITSRAPSIAFTDFISLKAQWLSESILLSAVSDWLKKLGLVSFNKVKIRLPQFQPEFGHFYWDLTAPSYIHPFSTFDNSGRPCPGFIVGDVNLNSDCGPSHIASTLNKCKILRTQKNIRPFMPMIVAGGFSSEAHAECKNNGVLPATTRNLFGDDVASALKELVLVLSTAASKTAHHPESIFNIFQSLSRIEGAAANLRGALFPLIVSHYAVTKYGGGIDIGRGVSDPVNAQATDIDVLLVKSNIEIRAYECRGKILDSQVSVAEVQEWLEKKIPIVRRWLKNRPDLQTVTHNFELWTTGTLAPEAKQLLLKTSTKTKKYNILWKDGADVLKALQEINPTVA
jgi:hypothetical protein